MRCTTRTHTKHYVGETKGWLRSRSVFDHETCLIESCRGLNDNKTRSFCCVNDRSIWRTRFGSNYTTLIDNMQFFVSFFFQRYLYIFIRSFNNWSGCQDGRWNSHLSDFSGNWRASLTKVHFTSIVRNQDKKQQLSKKVNYMAAAELVSAKSDGDRANLCAKTSQLWPPRRFSTQYYTASNVYCFMFLFLVMIQYDTLMTTWLLLFLSDRVARVGVLCTKRYRFAWSDLHCISFQFSI